MSTSYAKKYYGLRGLMRSIRVKVTVILIVLMGAFTASGYLVYDVLEKISGDMLGLTATQLPRAQLSADITLNAAKAKDQMLELMLADDFAVLAETEQQVAETKEMLSEQIAQLYASERETLERAVKVSTDSLIELSAAKRKEFEIKEQIDALVIDLQNTSRGLQSRMRALASDAYEQLTFGGAETVTAVDTVLSDLVETDFLLVQNLFEARAEVNLLAGAAIALGLTTDPDMAKTLNNIAKKSEVGLLMATSRLKASGQTLIDHEILSASLTTLKDIVRQNKLTTPRQRQAALDARTRADDAIRQALGETKQQLALSVKTSQRDNKKSIQGLLDNEVGFLNRILVINNALSAYQVGVLGVIAATTVEQVEVGKISMEKAMQEIGSHTLFGFDALDAELTALGRVNDPETGIVALKIKALNVERGEHAATERTANAVLEISRIASDLGSQVRSDIEQMAAGVSSQVLDVERNMIAVGLAMIGLFIFMMLMMQIWVSRPLNRISAATERLASGDRSPVVGFDRSSTEVHRIAASLAVFRDGIVEHEEQTKIAEQERANRQADQDKAVLALGHALSKLSAGDLTSHIKDTLTEGYEQLRQDFNNTLDTLNDTIGEVVDASVSIQGGASEISQASDDLAHRTESQAATLEETAAALDELTESVRSAADGARNVEQTVENARVQAEESSVVVKNAVGAMNEIEQSSTKISQIISVIDDIAFQTNLLALNAGVEAARAGDAGRGFAVVASEVRGLAQRSSDAAMEIKGLISESSVYVENGVELVGQAGGALQMIMERVNEISGLVSNIATGANEQSVGLNEINVGMTQLDQVTQQNAAMVEQATAASQLLKTDSSNLTGLTSRFQTSSTTKGLVNVDVKNEETSDVAA